MERIKSIASLKACRKLSATLMGAMAVTLSAYVFAQTGLNASSCQDGQQMCTNDASRVAAHAVQQCDGLATVEVSWLEWVSGKSSSYQFHLFDLLELLYGNSDRDFQPSSGK